MPKKLKILMAMDAYLPEVDGVINCMHNYCMHSYKDIDLTVAVPKNRRKYKDNLPYRTIRCKSVYIPLLGLHYGLPSMDRKFYKQILSEEFDIIHIHSPFAMAKFALKIARKKNIPIVATFHSNFRPIFQKVFLFKGIAEIFVRKLGRFYNKLDQVFTCTSSVAEQVRSYGYTGQITVLPFGTELKRVDDIQPLREAANVKLGIDDSRLAFLFVGRVMPLKRIDYILRALKIVKSKGIDFKFYIVGKGPTIPLLASLAKKLGLQQEVCFLGFIDRPGLPEIFARADLFLFPSLYDNFGLVKVESAAYHTPGVFIKGSQSGYGVTDNVDGFLSDDNEEAFAETILNAIADRQRLKEIGENANKNLYISWQDCTQMLLNKYQEIGQSLVSSPEPETEECKV